MTQTKDTLLMQQYSWMNFKAVYFIHAGRTLALILWNHEWNFLLKPFMNPIKINLKMGPNKWCIVDVYMMDLKNI